MHVHVVPDNEASGAVREMYDADIATDGYVHNYTRLFSLNPGAYAAWRSLITSIRQTMDLRRYELVTLSAAMALRCRYCVSAHGHVIESKVLEREQLERIVRDYRDAGLTPAEVALMALAEKIALHAYRVTPEDVEELRALGLSEAEIFNAALAASARAFFSKALDSMGAQPDDAYGSSLELFDLLDARAASSA